MNPRDRASRIRWLQVAVLLAAGVSLVSEALVWRFRPDLWGRYVDFVGSRFGGSLGGLLIVMALVGLFVLLFWRRGWASGVLTVCLLLSLIVHMVSVALFSIWVLRQKVFQEAKGQEPRYELTVGLPSLVESRISASVREQLLAPTVSDERRLQADKVSSADKPIEEPARNRAQPEVEETREPELEPIASEPASSPEQDMAESIEEQESTIPEPEPAVIARMVPLETPEPGEPQSQEVKPMSVERETEMPSPTEPVIEPKPTFSELKETAEMPAEQKVEDELTIDVKQEIRDELERTTVHNRLDEVVPNRQTLVESEQEPEQSPSPRKDTALDIARETSPLVETAEAKPVAQVDVTSPERPVDSLTQRPPVAARGRPPKPLELKDAVDLAMRVVSVPVLVPESSETPPAEASAEPGTTPRELLPRESLGAARSEPLPTASESTRVRHDPKPVPTQDAAPSYWSTPVPGGMAKANAVPALEDIRVAARPKATAFSRLTVGRPSSGLESPAPSTEEGRSEERTHVALNVPRERAQAVPDVPVGRTVMRQAVSRDAVREDTLQTFVAPSARRRTDVQPARPEGEAVRLGSRPAAVGPLLDLAPTAGAAVAEETPATAEASAPRALERVLAAGRSGAGAVATQEPTARPAPRYQSSVAGAGLAPRETSLVNQAPAAPQPGARETAVAAELAARSAGAVSLEAVDVRTTQPTVASQAKATIRTAPAQSRQSAQIGLARSDTGTALGSIDREWRAPEVAAAASTGDGSAHVSTFVSDVDAEAVSAAVPQPVPSAVTRSGKRRIVASADSLGIAAHMAESGSGEQRKERGAKQGRAAAFKSMNVAKAQTDLASLDSESAVGESQNAWTAPGSYRIPERLDVLPVTRKETRVSIAEGVSGQTDASPRIRSLVSAESGVRPKAVSRKSIYRLRSPETRREHIEELGGSRETEAAVEAALAWLAEAQSDDGHWDVDAFKTLSQCGGAGDQADGDVAVTGLSLLAYLGAGYTHKGGQYSEALKKGLAWLVAGQRADGDLRRGGQMYGQAMATAALSESLSLTGDGSLRAPLERAVRFILSAQNPEAGWRYQPQSDDNDTSVVGWQILALKSAQIAGVDVPEEHFRWAGLWLDRVRKGERGGLYSYKPGHGATPVMTAEGWFAQLFMEGDARIRGEEESAAYIMDNLPSWSPEIPAATHIYYWYYGTLALHLSGAKAFDQWNASLTSALLEGRAEDGPAAGSWDPVCQLGPRGGRIYATAIATLCLEVYYRYLPFYRQE